MHRILKLLSYKASLQRLSLPGSSRVFSLTDNEVTQICDFHQVIETAAFELALACNPKALVKDMENVVAKMKEAQKKSHSTPNSMD